MTTMLESRPRASAPVELTTRYLDQHGIRYEVFDHEPRFTAAAEALACGVAPHRAAKGIVMRDAQGRHWLVVIPASDHLDLRKLRRLLRSPPGLRLATEQELDAEFPELEVGAVPPFGAMLAVPEVVDERLLDDRRRVLCNSGDHRHSLLVDSSELASLAGTRVADVCED